MFQEVLLPEPDDEEDVHAERLKIYSGGAPQDILLIKDLSKVNPKN